MREKAIHLICIGAMISASVVFSGCGGGSSGSSSSTYTPTSSVGGTVSGLIGSGLVLQNNNKDNLAITADQKTFRFHTRIIEGNKSNVTILTQPTNPAQSCEVINGNRTVGVNNITDVQVRCVTNVSETFESGRLDSSYWNTSGQYDRKLIDSKLQFNLAATGEFAFDHLPFRNNNCGKVSADVNIDKMDFTGTGGNDFRTVLQSCGYHSNMAGEAPGIHTGDVEAAITWSGGSQASYTVFRCLKDECNDANSIEFLTPNGSKGVALGTTAPNSTATLSIDWNSTLYPEQFTFQLNDDTPKIFNPVTAGAAIASAAPNKPDKYLGVQISISGPNNTAEMTANFDNVTDGPLTDNFDINNEKHLSGSFWEKTDGMRRIENGQLVMESAQEYVGDPGADSRFNNTTSLKTHDGMIIRGDEVAEADITLDPQTFVVDNGNNPAEVYALLDMEYRPAGSLQNDYTNSFVVRAALKEGPQSPGPAVTAEILAEGCADFTCSTKYTIASANQTFTTPVGTGQKHHFKIERRENGVFDITLDGQETLSVNLSSVPGFASTTFSAVSVSTASSGTDLPGEEAFIRALFDNVQAGS